MKSFALFTLASMAVGAIASSLGDSDAHYAAVVRHHRRHHVRRDYDLVSKRATTSSKKCKVSKSKHSSGKSSSSSSSSKSKSKSKSTATATAGSSAATASSSSSSSSKSSGSSSSSCPSGSITVNGVCIGMLPDGGSDGGSRNTMAQLNTLVSTTSKKHATFGQYAQYTSASWDGSQLLQVLDDVKESGAIFQPAVMPTAGWAGLTNADNSGARQICTIMKKFNDEGIEVWLRFAHEVNWYLTDGTYQGSKEDFLEAWDVVAKACREIAPETKMFFTPNMADFETLKAFYPTDKSTVDVIGIDFYPKDASNLDGVFLSAAKDFHDEFCTEDGPIFSMGETGLASGGTADQKMTWLKSMVAAKDQMQHLHSISWFNYVKSENGMSNIPFKIVDPDDSDVTSAYISYIS